MSATLSRGPSAPPVDASPPALRSRRPSWRDPRLAVGLLLVCGSVVTGARVLAAADDTVAVLSVRAPLTAGQQVHEEDLVVTRVRFASSADADRYLPADAPWPADAVLVRPVGVGELLPRAAVDAAGTAATLDLPLAVRAERVPVGVRAGSVVDVWASGAGRGPAEPLLRGVPVRSTSRPGGAGPGGLRQLVVAVPEARGDELADVVARLDPDTLLVVLRAG